MGLMSHTLLAGQAQVDGRPWGDGETLLVPVGQEAQRVSLAEGGYMVLLSIYHPLARPAREGPQVRGRATVMAVVPGAKPLVLETAQVDLVESGRRSLRVIPPGAASPWRPSPSSVEVVKLIPGPQESHHLKLRLTKASAQYLKRGEWPGWSLTWRNYFRGIQQAAPPDLVLAFVPGDGDLARRAADLLSAPAEGVATPQRQRGQGRGPPTPQ